MNLQTRFCVAALLVVSAFGCGTSSSEPPLVAAKGVVTWKMKPLAGAAVRFIPVGDTKGGGGDGVTGADGAFGMKSVRGGVGLPEGEYKVVISKWAMPDGSAPPPNVAPMDSGAKETLPAKYSDESRTTLKAHVKNDGKAHPFNLN